MVDVDIESLKQESWTVALATGVAYGVLLAVMTALLFGVPYVIFRLLFGTV